MATTSPQHLPGELQQEVAPRSPGSLETAVLTAILTAVLCIIIVLTALGNLLVMVALCKDRHLRKKKTNYFIVSLAFADLLVAVVVMPFAAIELTTGHWRYGHVFCLVRTSLDVQLTTASILHLCCIALDRYYAICCQPLVYRHKMTPVRVAAMLGGCWLIPTFISFLPIMQSWNAIGIEDIIEERRAAAAAAAGDGSGGGTTTNATSCIFLVNWPYALVCSAVAFYVPLALMLLAYQRIYVTAMSHVRQIETLQRAGSAPVGGATPSPPAPPPPAILLHLSTSSDPLNNHQTAANAGSSPCSSSTPCPGPISYPGSTSLPGSAPWSPSTPCHGSAPCLVSTPCASPPPDQASSSRLRLETKAAKTLAIIMGCFCACWAPFFLTNVLDPFLHYSVPWQLWTAWLWLGYVNSGLNPFLYAFLNRAFRRAFLLVLCCGHYRRRRHSRCRHGRRRRYSHTHQGSPAIGCHTHGACSPSSANGTSMPLRLSFLPNRSYSDNGRTILANENESQESVRPL